MWCYDNFWSDGFSNFEKEFAAKEKLEIVLSAPVPAYSSGRQGEAGGRGVWGEFRPPSPASSVRIFSNRHRFMFQSPTHGQVDLEKLRHIVSKYMADDKKAKYEIIVGTDSQKTEKGGYDFVSALVIHRIGFGGIYFWKREIYNKKMALKERIYREATMSLETSENFVTLFKTNGISRYDIQIHVDIGPNGDTRDMINEVSGMIRGSGYDVKIKPYSYGASKVADRYT